jgi:REP element-mobilizing transposase RayT
MPQRRRQRLPLDAYAIDGSVWHATICASRQVGPVFADPANAGLILDTFESGCRFLKAIPYVVCIMPDHVHLLVEVRDIGLVDLIGRIKSFSMSQWWKQGNQGMLWQESFYDHGIRGSRDFDATMTYILNNPVSAELVSEWEVYPFIAGTLIREDDGSEMDGL